MIRNRFVSFAGAAVIVWPRAWAQAAPEADRRETHAPPFGARGEFVVSGASLAGFSWTWWDTRRAWDYSATFSPGLDFFVARNVSIGASVYLGYTDDFTYRADGGRIETESSTLRFGVRGGVNLPLGSDVSWYPRLSIGVESVRSNGRVVPARSLSTPVSALGYPSKTQWVPWFELFAPVLFHPKPHLFVGAGPNIFHCFGQVQGAPDGGGQRTSVGGGVVFGGWWGGELPRDSAPPPTPPVLHRFGRAHQFVISGEAGLSTNQTTYAGIPSSSRTITVAPAVDYFIVDRVSLGIALTVRSSSATGVDPDRRSPVFIHGTDVGGALRVGVDLPIATWLSFYPRAGVFAGIADHYDSSIGQNDQYDERIVSVVLSAPLLLHLAPHAFVGFGPWASRDIVRSAEDASVQNRSTSAGAALLVGGWID